MLMYCRLIWSGDAFIKFSIQRIPQYTGESIHWLICYVCNCLALLGQLESTSTIRAFKKAHKWGLHRVFLPGTECVIIIIMP
jgi:hypothetical protein